MNYISSKISDQFKAVAYIDWLGLSIQTAHITNRWTIQRILREELNLPEGRNVWVKPQDEAEGGAASIFYIRIQDPKSYEQVYRAVSKIEEEAKGFLRPPQIIDIEFGLDFYAKLGNHDRLPELLTMLAGRHHTHGNNPRAYLPSSGKTESLTMPGMRLDGDGTYYVGHRKKDLLYWKAYVKRVDQVRHEDGKTTAVPLPTEHHRTRIEVTLQHEAPKTFGLATLTDLEHFEFGKLAKLFNFRKALDVERMPKDSPLMRLVRTKLRQLADATEDRGAHSFEGASERKGAKKNKGIGKVDKWGRIRKHSTHTETDRALNKTTRERLSGLSTRFAKKDDGF